MSKQDPVPTAHAELAPSAPVPSAQSLPFEPTVEATAIQTPVGGPSVPPSSGLVLNDRYVIECELGRGGMSRVFIARDIKLDRRVAIKFLAPGTHADDELRRFEQEARAAGSLNHPNVLTVHDVGTHEGNPYIVSELLEGGTLREELEGARFTVEESIDYAAQMADGLAAAHEKGIVHRDLKPENLFITREGRLKILDFGIAKLVATERSSPEQKSPEQTQAGAILGTMGYMSPEQMHGEHADHRSDIFSAGVIVYEMLSGKRAFKASSSVETAYAILNENPPELSEHVPDDLQSVVWRCLEKKPEERFQSARELGLQLRKISSSVSNGSETRASSEAQKGMLQTASPSVRRWPPRLRSGQVFAATVAVVLLIVFLSTLSVGRWRERLLGIARRADVPAAANQARRSVAVLGFKNLSGRPEEAWLSTALSEMLSTELAAGEKLETIPGESVAHMRAELALPDADALAKETLLRIRKNVLADLVVLGSYVHLGKEAGGQMRLDVRLQDAEEGMTIAVFSETGTEKDLFGLVSRAGAKMRKKLGVGEVSTSEAGVVRASLPSNVEAARLYSEGLAKLRVYDALGARGLLEKAVLIEPNHALSHSALSEAWSKLGYDAKESEEAKKAFELAENFSREDRLAVEGRYRLTTHEWGKAVDAFKTLWDFFPDNVEYGVCLARAQILASKGKEALATVEALSKLPPPKGEDPRIDIVEAEASQSILDFDRAQQAAARAAARSEVREARLLLAGARHLQGAAFSRQGKLKQARAAYEEAQPMYAAAGDRLTVAKVSNNIGLLLSYQGDLVGAKAMYEQALAVFREVGNQSAVALALSNLGLVLTKQGNLDGAMRMYEQALPLHQELGHRKSVAEAQLEIGLMLSTQGNLAGAKRSFRESETVAREIKHPWFISYALQGLAGVLAEEGDFARAKESLHRAIAIYRERIEAQRGNNNPKTNEISLATALDSLGSVLRDEGDLGGARKSAEEALAIRKQLEKQLREKRLAESEVSLASLDIEEGRPSAAEALARKAVERYQTAQAPEREVLARVALAKSFLAEGEPRKAEEAIARAVEIAGKSQSPSLRFQVDITFARVRASMHNVAEAKKTLNATLAEAKRLGFFRQQLEARFALGETEMKSSQSAAGCLRLAALEKDATAHGFGLIARKAAAASRLPKP